MSAALTVSAVWRPPFAEGRPTVVRFAPDVTVAGMVEALGLGEAFKARGAVIVAGPAGEHALERARWGRIRLKPGQVATFHLPLTGGGAGDNGDSGAAVLGVVIAIATALTAGAAAAGLFAVGGLFTAGSVSAQLLGAAISLAGAMLQSAIARPPVADEARTPEQGAAAISGNVLGPGAAIPRVLGERRVYPPLLAPPLIERIGRDEIAEAVFALAGPHRLSAIRLGDTPIEETDDVEIETREGWPDDAALVSLARYGKTTTPSAEIARHALDPDDSDRETLDNQDDATKSLPKWRAGGFVMADEAWLHFTLPEGLAKSGASATALAVPLRLRLKHPGSPDAWVNLPELHFAGDELGELRATVILKRGAAPVPTPEAPSGSGFVAAYAATPGQAAPASEGWTADAAFRAGAAVPNGLYRGNEGSSGVPNVTLTAERATLYFDADDFPAGDWAVEVKRGAAYEPANFSKSTYAHSGTVLDFFAWRVVSGEALIPVKAKDFADRLWLARVVAVTNAHPVAGGADGPGLALIAVRIRNRGLDRLSVLAGGYVGDWDGTGWNDVKVTSNPAPHYRDVLVGGLSGDPLPESLIDEANLVDWRAACAASAWTADLICEGQGVAELLGVLAGCGYARPRASEKWGVTRDYDRSAEDPVQVFTPRNSAGLTMAKAFARLPDALRTVWTDRDGRPKEKLVWREGREGQAFPRIEELRLEGVIDEAAATAQAVYLLRAGKFRSAFWRFRAPAEAVRCTRGDLVAVNADMLSRWHGAGRVAEIDIADGAIAALRFDAEPPEAGTDDMLATADMLAVADMGTVGVTLAMLLRRADGTLTQHALARTAGAWAFPAAPIALALAADGAPDIRAGSLAAFGPAGAIARRLVIGRMTPDEDMHFDIEAVDEAPEIWA